VSEKLISELVERIKELERTELRKGFGEEAGDPKNWQNEWRESLAHECLRQMEWARREAMNEAIDLANKNERDLETDVRHSVEDMGWPTVAPPYWKPPE